MRNNILKISFGVIVGIFIAFSFKSCVDTSNEFVTQYETVTVSDTTYIKGDEVITYITSEPNVIYKYMPSDIVPSDGTTVENTYIFDINNQDITGFVSVESVSEVKDFSIEYSVTSKEINRTDTILVDNTITNTITNFVPSPGKHKFFLGTELAFGNNNILGTAFNATWQMKSDYQVYYEYGLSFDNQPNQHRVGVKIPIRRRKK